MRIFLFRLFLRRTNLTDQ